jgi:hypothetical protein
MGEKLHGQESSASPNLAACVRGLSAGRPWRVTSNAPAPRRNQALAPANSRPARGSRAPRAPPIAHPPRYIPRRPNRSVRAARSRGRETPEAPAPSQRVAPGLSGRPGMLPCRHRDRERRTRRERPVFRLEPPRASDATPRTVLRGSHPANQDRHSQIEAMHLIPGQDGGRDPGTSTGPARIQTGGTVRRFSDWRDRSRSSISRAFRFPCSGSARVRRARAAAEWRGPGSGGDAGAAGVQVPTNPRANSPASNGRRSPACSPTPTA